RAPLPAHRPRAARPGRRRLGRAPRARPPRPRRRERARARPRSGAQPAPPRAAERLDALAAFAHARARALRVPQEALAHRRLAGPAPPHRAGLATAAHAHGPRPRRRRRARSPRRGPGRARRVPRGGRGGVGRAPAAPRARRRPRARALRAPERARGALRGVGLAARPAAQVDDAHLPQRAAGDLRGVDAGDRAGAGRPPGARAPRRSAVLRPLRTRAAALHGGLALLRSASLAQLPRRLAPHLAALAAALAPAAAGAVELVGTWHVLVHYRDAKTANPDAERWEDRLWIFEAAGERLRWTEYPIVVFDDETGRFERRERTGQYARVLHFWAPSEAQLANIRSGLAVNDRGSQVKTLHRAEQGWSSAERASPGGVGVITYQETWSIEQPQHLPVFRQRDVLC